ncbi:MAG: hypothetical protein WBC22_09670 [Sedimentisphaerales bacterium]
MSEANFKKDPDAVLDYAFDWSGSSPGPWLETGETIESHVVTVDAGLTNDSDSESSGIVTVWLSGGTAGTSYNVACKIVTNMGRTDERSITILVEER